MSAMDFTVDKGDGNGEHVIDEQYIASQLKSLGYDVAGTSDDGMTMTFNQPGGGGKDGAPAQYQAKVPDMLQKMGFQVKGMQPSSSDTEHIDPAIGAEVQKIPGGDDVRRAFVESRLKHRGIENPQVAGSGNNWHVFNPTTSQWIQVTKDPGWDKTGLYSAGLAIPHIAGMALGGAAGTTLGGPLGGAALAGAGGAAGEALTQGGLSLFDPDYRDAMKGHGSDVAWDAAQTGGLDALGYGGGQLLGKALPPLLSKGAQIGGQALEALGGGTAKAAGAIASSPTASSLAADMTPYLGPVSFAGQLAQAPAAAVRGVTKAAARAGSEESALGPLLGAKAGPIADTAESLLAKRPASSLASRFQQGAEAIARPLGNRAAGSEEAGARDILGNAVSRQRATAAYHANPENALAETHAADAVKEAVAHNPHFSPDMVDQTTKDVVGTMRAKDIARMMTQDMSEENWGSRVGGAIDGLSRAGTGVENVGKQATRLGLRGIQGAGLATQAAGIGLNAAGTVTQPLELPLLMRYGIMPKLYNWWEDRNKEP